MRLRDLYPRTARDIKELDWVRIENDFFSQGLEHSAFPLFLKKEKPLGLVPWSLAVAEWESAHRTIPWVKVHPQAGTHFSVSPELRVLRSDWDLMSWFSSNTESPMPKPTMVLVSRHPETGAAISVRATQLMAEMLDEIAEHPMTKKDILEFGWESAGDVSETFDLLVDRFILTALAPSR